jgi:putative transposase
MHSYIQIYFHIFFAVKYRQALIRDDWRDRLHQYSIGLIQGRQHKVLAINSVEDHIHLLVGYRPLDPLPVLMRELKSNTSAWINTQGFTPGRFAWQVGYTAISVGPRSVQRVCAYIARQKEHHAKQKYRKEAITLLDNAGIEWKPEYLFTEPIDNQCPGLRPGP